MLEDVRNTDADKQIADATKKETNLLNQQEMI